MRDEFEVLPAQTYMPSPLGHQVLGWNNFQQPIQHGLETVIEIEIKIINIKMTTWNLVVTNNGFLNKPANGTKTNPDNWGPKTRISHFILQETNQLGEDFSLD